MRNLRVELEYLGKFVLVGEICGESEQDAAFRYASSWLKVPDARPISVSLPLQEEAFSPETTRNYFEGLLPEGYVRWCIAGQLSAAGQDYLSVLSALGKECLGALKITEGEEDEISPSYRLLTDQELEAFAQEGAMKSAELVIRSHLSLTGASGKTGLYLNPADGRWYLPQGTAASTHIVKQSHIRLKKIVANEILCLRTARRLGIEVPEHFMLAVHPEDEETALFITKRYDRFFAKEEGTRNGMRLPCRLHQEDFAQALGIPASRKYETGEKHYLKRAFDLLRKYASDPIRDQQKLWDICIFNCLIGNTDNHLKNMSLLYSADLRSIRLAPAYDIVSTVLYEGSTMQMGISIGGERDIRKITRDSFEQEARSLGIGVRMAMQRFDEMQADFEKALRESAAETENEYPGVRMQDACEKILRIH